MEQMESRGGPGPMVEFPWWVFLITGIAWMIIAVIVLRFQADPVTSVATVGFLIGSLFVFAAINEYVAASMVDTWKWLHWLMALLFVLGRSMDSSAHTTRSSRSPPCWGSCWCSWGRSTSS